MKTIEEIIKNDKIIYLWKDKKTLDIEVNNTDLSIAEELKKFVCSVCENPILSKDSPILGNISNTDTGATVVCSCKQKWFIHKPIVVPKNLTDLKQ